MLGAVFGGVRGGAAGAGEVVEEVEGGDGGALGVAVAHEEAIAAEDGRAARAREPQHAQPAAAKRGRCGPPRLVSPFTALSSALQAGRALWTRQLRELRTLTRLAHSAQHAPNARYIHHHSEIFLSLLFSTLQLNLCHFLSEFLVCLY